MKRINNMNKDSQIELREKILELIRDSDQEWAADQILTLLNTEIEQRLKKQRQKITKKINSLECDGTDGSCLFELLDYVNSLPKSEKDSK